MGLLSLLLSSVLLLLLLFLPSSLSLALASLSLCSFSSWSSSSASGDCCCCPCCCRKPNTARLTVLDVLGSNRSLLCRPLARAIVLVQSASSSVMKHADFLLREDR